MKLILCTLLLCLTVANVSPYMTREQQEALVKRIASGDPSLPNARMIDSYEDYGFVVKFLSRTAKKEGISTKLSPQDIANTLGYIRLAEKIKIFKDQSDKGITSENIDSLIFTSTPIQNVLQYNELATVIRANAERHNIDPQQSLIAILTLFKQEHPRYYLDLLTDKILKFQEKHNSVKI